MVPLVVLIVSFVTFHVLGRLGLRPFKDGVICLRGALTLMLLLTASAHFGSQRADLVRMVPPALPNPELLVTFTGITELACAIGFLIPRAAPWAAAVFAFLLLAMFPANVHAANLGLSIGGRPVPALGTRTVIQLVFLAATLIAGFAPAWARRRQGPVA